MMPCAHEFSLAFAPGNSAMNRHFLPLRGCLALAVLAILLLPLAAARAQPDEAETRQREVLKLKLGFPRYVLDNDAFPKPAFDQPAQADKLLGPHTIKTTYYDSNYRPVESAQANGPYAAVVVVTPKTGRPLTRYFTLYRITPPTAAFNDNHSYLAATTGIPRAALEREARLVVEYLKNDITAWAGNQRGARLLAGLHQTKTVGPVRAKTEDAFAWERQWWVGLHRKLTGLDKTYPKAFVAPTPRDRPAPVVRAGTEAEAGVKPGTAEKLDKLLQTWADDDDQAFAVCVVRKGVIVLHRAYGTRDGQPMTVDTKSWMASITKAMSATLMMMLVDQGLVQLDDPVEKYLPAFKGVRTAEPLTIRRLYNHTSGLDKWPGVGEDQPDLELRVAEYYPHLQIGKAWGYNGAGYMVGGKIIEAVSGEAVPLFFQRHLLGPLGCTGTDVVGTQADAYSIPLDMAKIGQLLLNRGSYGPHRFFSEETFAQMLPRPLGLPGKDAKRTFGVGLDGKEDRFGHGAASAATFHVDRIQELVVVMTRNKMGKNQGRYNGKFWETLQAGIEKN
jgi:CubicO group peptidase (beta-lactamase class C family)